MKTWGGWSEAARAVFNSVYQQMRREQRTFLHPKTAKVKDDQWNTIAWNAAWTAADAVDGVNATAVRS